MRKRSDVQRTPEPDPPAPEVSPAASPTDSAALRMGLAMRSVENETYVGEAISLTLGPEVYSPVKYNTFTVGPFACTVVRQNNESTAEAVQRGYRLLLELNEAEFNLAWERHRARLSKMPRQKGD